MAEVQIQVFLSREAKATGKKVFERIVGLNNSVSVDYDCVVKVMRFLFGSQSVVSFNIF